MPIQQRPRTTAARAIATARAADCARCGLREVCILRKLAAERRSAAAAPPSRRSVRQRRRLFEAETDCSELMVVAEGLVVTRMCNTAGEAAIVELVRPGQIVDYRALLPCARHLASAEAQVATEVCCLSAQLARRLVMGGGRSVLELVGQVGIALERLQQMVMMRAHVPIQTRVQQALLEMAEHEGTQSPDGSWQLELPLRRSDLAALVGARPETLSRIVRTIEEAGLAHFRGRHVTIPSLGALRSPLVPPAA